MFYISLRSYYQWWSLWHRAFFLIVPISYCENMELPVSWRCYSSKGNQCMGNKYHQLFRECSLFCFTARKSVYNLHLSLEGLWRQDGWILHPTALWLEARHSQTFCLSVASICKMEITSEGCLEYSSVIYCLLLMKSVTGNVNEVYSSALISISDIHSLHTEH